MKIVIDIPKRMYEKICNNTLGIEIFEAIKNGTPLPEHHGRLIDADELMKNSFYVTKEELLSVIALNDLILAPTIIEGE